MTGAAGSKATDPQRYSYGVELWEVIKELLQSNKFKKKNSGETQNHPCALYLQC
jgi:hypothetical protein